MSYFALGLILIHVVILSIYFYINDPDKFGFVRMFDLDMERKVYISFILSAIIFLTGAIGFDILGANEASLNGEETIVYSILYTIEESLEMFGLIYLIHILLGLLENININITKVSDQKL